MNEDEIQMKDTCIQEKEIKTTYLAEQLRDVDKRPEKANEMHDLSVRGNSKKNKSRIEEFEEEYSLLLEKSIGGLEEECLTYQKKNRRSGELRVEDDEHMQI